MRHSPNLIAAQLFSFAAVGCATTLEAVAGRWVMVAILLLSQAVPFTVGVLEALSERKRG